MGKLVAVIGLGLLGSTIAREATAIGHEVLAIDKDVRRVEVVKDEVAHAVRADALEVAALKNLGIKSCHTAIVAIGSDDLATIMITMNLKSIGIENVISRASGDVHAAILQRLGVTDVVLPERQTGIRIAHTFAVPRVMEYLELTRNHGVSKIRTPQSLVGKSLLDSGLSFKYGLYVLALVRGQEVMVNPSGLTTKIGPEDILVLVGNDEQLEKVQQLDA